MRRAARGLPRAAATCKAHMCIALRPSRPPFAVCSHSGHRGTYEHNQLSRKQPLAVPSKKLCHQRSRLVRNSPPILRRCPYRQHGIAARCNGKCNPCQHQQSIAELGQNPSHHTPTHTARDPNNAPDYTGRSARAQRLPIQAECAGCSGSVEVRTTSRRARSLSNPSARVAWGTRCAWPDRSLMRAAACLANLSMSNRHDALGAAGP